MFWCNYNRCIAVGLMLLSLIKRETCHFISLQLSMLLIINGNFSVQTLGVITRKTASTIIFKEVYIIFPSSVKLVIKLSLAFGVLLRFHTDIVPYNISHQGF